MNTNGKTAIVTGAGSGLGLATCRMLAQASASVWGLERDAARFCEIEACGPSVSALPVDVISESSGRDAIAKVVERTGAVHISVNCAGVLKAALTVSRQGVSPLAAWDEVIAVNLTGTFNVVRYAALAMTANAPDAGTGERGVIVNVASSAATQGQIGQAAYSASKAGVVGMTLPWRGTWPLRDPGGGERPGTVRHRHGGGDIGRNEGGHSRSDGALPEAPGPPRGVRT